ncbi:YdaU family protein [Mycoavidus cysteinexigens]|uniref:YdaU family protein n=1 Tax=Mycoavidus cysteinexigens TaxID=1553431 RepID=UPI0006936E93|nr:DUF1376 domain-containing protein [Mycoavidus cysteinexigens]GAM52702.1 primosomal protein I [bacterium endosymbiont of Mortierella elongata FMR23-6]
MSQKPNIWMPLYIADYLADTTRLTTEQHGAYLLLIMDYWRNGALPDDDAALANITRLSLSHWKKQRGALSRLFQVGHDEWRHKRIDTELERVARNSVKHTERARKAATKRWSKQSFEDATSNACSNASAMLDECPSQSHSYSPSSSKKEGDKSPSTPRTREKPAVTLPDWLAKEDWLAFTEHRKRLKAPMSEVAQVRAIAELSRLRDNGHDPSAVLNQSIVNGWKGLFDLKRHEAHGFNRQAMLEARNAQACLEAKALIFGESADAIL